MWLSGTLGCGWGVEGGVGLKDVAGVLKVEWDFRMWLSGTLGCGWGINPFSPRCLFKIRMHSLGKVINEKHTVICLCSFKEKL